MRKLLVIEGPDGSGKSTLVEKLAYDLGFKRHHTGGPPKTREELEQKFAEVALELAAAPVGLILDRHPAISEPIYRDADNGHCLIAPAAMMFRLEQLRPLVIFCRRESMRDMYESISLAKKAHKSPEHLEMVLRRYRNVVEGYDALFANPDNYYFPLIRYDWAVHSYPQLVEKIKLCAD